MSTSSKPNTSGNTRWSRFYVTMGVICLVFMSLLWSLDDSFAYILFGLASWFIFLWYWKNPQALQFISEKFQNSFDGKRSYYEGKQSHAKRNYTGATGYVNGRTIVKWISIVFAAAFFLLVFFAVLSGGSEEDNLFLYNKAQQYNYDNQPDSAKLYFRKVIDNEPDNTDAWVAYGNILLNQQEFDSSIFYYDHAIAVNPDLIDARYNKSVALYNKEEYSQVRDEASKILDIDFNYDNARLIIGDTYYAQKMYDSALVWYQPAYENGYRNAQLCHIMAYIYDTRADYENAIPLYQETLSMDSSRVDIYKRLGELLPDETLKYQQLYLRKVEEQ